MAKFYELISELLKAEGGYTIDSGGETWKGVARKFWPQWEGWAIIDSAKRNPGWSYAENEEAYKANTRILSKFKQLDDLVVRFYKAHFFDVVGADRISCQAIAGVVFDSAVNEGVSVAVKRCQDILGMKKTGIVTQELIDKINSL